ncbi:prosaposin-like isoform X2 [Mustelus asterias]
MSLFVCLALLFFTPVVASLAETDKECAHGKVKQCQDLKAASECKAVSKCEKTEWKKPKVYDDTCNACKKFMEKATGLVKRKSQQQVVNNTLHEGCHSMLIQESEDRCTANVDSYLHIINRFLKKKMKPDVLCAALGLCKARPKKFRPQAFPEGEPDMSSGSLNCTEGPPSGSAFTCDFCQLVVKKLKKLLPKKKNKGAVSKATRKTCSLLQDKYSTKCNRFISDFGKRTTDLLYKKFTPSAVCDTLLLCSNRDSVLPIMECDMCENLMQQLQSARTEGTGVDILLSGACNPYSDISKLVCEDFIRSNKPTLSTLLENQEERDLCGELHLCVRKVEATLTGLDECTWAPSHWCTTLESALRCKNVKLCEELGWKYT